MRPWNRSNEDRDPLSASEQGSASLEFVAVGVLMLVPLAYLVIALATVQSQTLGAEAAARFAARTIASGPDTDPAAAVAQVAQQYDIDAATLDVSMSCLPETGVCPDAGSIVLLTVRAEVDLPFVPSVLGFDSLTSIPVEATAAHKVSRFWTGR
ncbi:TadE family protein [Microbacterium halotolerans]|uniref:TadE family protein n=1 Tax=Microbacterium halotolerans TaxID=246613 RepID=UPI000E6ACCE0|nr:TadE family protein [Microbacterium halotolerans]